MRFLGTLFERSLLVRLGVSMAAITVFALAGMVSSVIIAETTQGSGEAIDHAGSLRMQSYRIATLVLLAEQQPSPAAWAAAAEATAEFEHRLTDPRLTDVMPSDPQAGLSRAYGRVLDDWRHQLKPSLDAVIVMRPRHLPGQLTPLVHDIDGFVADINVMVKRLAETTDQRITLMRAVLGVALFLTLIVVFVTMYLMHTDVLIPLRDLLVCASDLGRGNLGARTEHTGQDELGRLGQTFNMMAEDLSKLYQDLEARVREKTIDLERSNQSLNLLYHSIARLHNGPVSPDTYTVLLRDIERVVGTGHGTACLVEGDGEHAHILASTLDPARGDVDLCTLSDCAQCLATGAIRLRRLDDEGQHQILSLPLRDVERQYGILQLEVGVGEPLEAWKMQLLEALARHIGIAMGTARRSEESRRVSVLEERAVIARELHDSLAQSLSYMKIQVSRLQALLGTETSGEPREVLNELREGLNGAYRQLRELLTTFRLKVTGGGLADALEATVREFRERGQIATDLRVHLTGCGLTPHEEIHVLQVVREALANVVHHARATHAAVGVECGADGVLRVTVDDDGVGIARQTRVRHHYGIHIMEERARSLGGKLDIYELQRGGTRVELRFRPGGAEADRSLERPGQLAT